jgi:hypothetical protein
VRRVEPGGVEEVLIATNPTTTGEATALHIADLLRGSARVTRLASGLPVGASTPTRSRWVGPSPAAAASERSAIPASSVDERPGRVSTQYWSHLACLCPVVPEQSLTWRPRHPTGAEEGRSARSRARSHRCR